MLLSSLASLCLVCALLREAYSLSYLLDCFRLLFLAEAGSVAAWCGVMEITVTRSSLPSLVRN